MTNEILASSSPASSAIIPSVIDRLLGSRGCMLTFHRTARDEEWSALPDRGFYLSVDFLDRLLADLKAGGWEVVTITQALERAASPQDCGRFVNISIDDVYKDTHELLMPLFRKHNCPATLFVTTGIPDGTLVMWTIGLETILQEQSRILLRTAKAAGVGAASLERDASTAELKQALFGEIFAAWETNDPKARYAEFCADHGYDPADLHARHAASWEMLRELARDPLVEIGAHTISHPRISALPDDIATREISGSRERLREQLGIEVEHFAFPYGRQADCGARDFAIAARAGFASAATTRKGLVRPGRLSDRYQLPRNTLNQARGNARLTLASHLTGASGLAARAMGRV